MIKNKDGSIVIGLMFLVVIIIFLFIFAYETALLIMMKQRNNDVAKNISSSIILNIDIKKMIKEGRISIDENKASNIAEIILNNSYDNFLNDRLSMFTEPSVDIVYNNISTNEIDISVITKIRSGERFIFYKDIEIISANNYKAYTEMPLSQLKYYDSPFIDFTWGNTVRFFQKIWKFLFGWMVPIPDEEDIIIFEEVF